MILLIYIIPQAIFQLTYLKKKKKHLLACAYTHTHMHTCLKGIKGQSHLQRKV